jgi:DNA-binding SARP family transcriptional activator/predicted ATPase
MAPFYSVQLFGSFLLWAGDRRVQKFSTLQGQALLAYLLLSRERQYPRQDLARLFWPDTSPQQAGQNLRQVLSRLRRDLTGPDPFGGGSGLLCLDHSLFDVDVLRFRALLRACDEHAHHSLESCLPCCERMEEAVNLYQGHLLSGVGGVGGVAFDEWLLLEREQAHRQVVDRLHILIRHHFSRQAYAQARDLSLRLCHLEPYTEVAWQRLIRALLLLGDRAGALAQYERARQILAEELGILPGPELTDLYRQIHAVDLDPRVIGSKVRQGELHHFPTAFTSFVGRQAELTEIVTGVADPACRLLTVTGPVGMGKSRLVAEAARQINRFDFPDGLYFVPLNASAPADCPEPSRPAHLTAALAQALNLTPQGQPPTQGNLFDALAHKRLCLVLDDFDAFTGCGAWVHDLLRAAPGVKLIITSRTALGLAQECRLSLAGIGPVSDKDNPAENPAENPAVALFIKRAQRVQPDFVPTSEDLAAIQTICRAMSGIPLAIEMAAAQIRVFDCAALAEQIPKQVGHLVHPWQDLPERHRSMKALFAATWQQLTRREQQLFARCAIFRESFDLAAAQAITGATAQDLAGLVDKSLIAQDRAGRYVIHELLRLFGEEQLAQDPEREQVWQAYGAYYDAG